MNTSLTKINICPAGIVLRTTFKIAKLTGLAAVTALLGMSLVSYLTLADQIDVRVFLFMLFFWLAAIFTISGFFDAFLAPLQTALILPGGIIFPFGSVLTLRGRRWRTWHELSLTKLNWSGGWSADRSFSLSDNLQLRYTDGSSANLFFCRMTKQDIEKLLIALEVWGPKKRRVGDFQGLRETLANSLISDGLISYTALWHADLSRRFSLSTFQPLPPGTSLKTGRYEIISQMSFGGFAAIYYALNSSGTSLVVKEIATDQLPDPEVRKAILTHMQREAILLSELNHPQIVHLLDTFVENNRFYIVLERITGKTLRQMVDEQGSLNEATVVKLAFEMVDILKYLHQQQPPIVHRDFTPENLILKENRHLVLIDFNAANQYLSSATGTIIGKHAYMPPEQIRGKAQPCSDYYAMGATLYFLLCGKDPEPLKHIAFPDHNCISLELQQLIFDLTERDLENRIDQIETINSRLENVIVKHIPGFKRITPRPSRD